MLPKINQENGKPASLKPTITATIPENRHLPSEKPFPVSLQSEHPASEKLSRTSSQNGELSSEKPLPTSTKNGHPQSEKSLPTTAQTASPISVKPDQGLPKIEIIVGVILLVVTIMLIVIIVIVLVKCCVRPRRASSAKKAKKENSVADTVTGNDVTFTEPNGLIPNFQPTDHVEYADINPQSLVPRGDTGGQEKASVDASKGFVYADLAFNNTVSGRGKASAVQQMHSQGIIEDDISQLYAKPMKKNK